MFQFIFQLILERSHHPILRECSRQNELTEEDGDIPLEEDNGSMNTVDDMTGDFEELPSEGIDLTTEYDHLIHQTILLIAKLLDFPSVYQAGVPEFYNFCYSSLQRSIELINQTDWNEELEDCSTILRVISNVTFSERNISVLLLLSNLIKYYS